MELVKAVYELIADFPKEEKYGLRSQIARAAVSIPSNIAEGSSRKSEMDFARFLEMALGSAFELETQIILAKDLELININKAKKILNGIDSVQKQLHNLIISIKQSKNK